MAQSFSCWISTLIGSLTPVPCDNPTLLFVLIIGEAKGGGAAVEENMSDAAIPVFLLLQSVQPNVLVQTSPWFPMSLKGQGLSNLKGLLFLKSRKTLNILHFIKKKKTFNLQLVC